MFHHRGFRCFMKKFSLCYSKEAYDPLLEEKEGQHHHSHYHHHHQHQLKVAKGFVPIIVGEAESKERKKYMIQVEYLSSPTFKALIDKLWNDQEVDFHLEDQNEGPMKLPCTPAAFEEVLEACDEKSCKDRRKIWFPKFSSSIYHQ